MYNEYQPTRKAFWVKVGLEAGLVVLGLVITASIWNAESKRTDREFMQRKSDALAAVEAEELRAKNQLEFQIRNEWLPIFLSGEQPELAERMILALQPDLAEEVYQELRNSLESAGLLDEEVETRLDSASQGASRAKKNSPSTAIEISRHDAREDADGAAASLQERDLGSATVHVRQSASEFVVLIEGLSSAEIANLLVQSLEVENPEVRVIDRNDEPPTGAALAVPDIYRKLESEALEDLRQAGFSELVVWRVPSSSVPKGFVREVVLNNGASAARETEVVDETGILIQRLASDTALAVKISAG